jgi:hypothetical protein
LKTLDGERHVRMSKERCMGKAMHASVQPHSSWFLQPAQRIQFSNDTTMDAVTNFCCKGEITNFRTTREKYKWGPELSAASMTSGLLNEGRNVQFGDLIDKKFSFTDIINVVVSADHRLDSTNPGGRLQTGNVLAAHTIPNTRAGMNQMETVHEEPY